MITIHSPEGPIARPPRTLAATTPSLAGLRIGVLDNRKPHARALLTQLAEALAERTGAHLRLVAAKTNAAVACEPQVLGQLREESDVVLTGSAD